MSRTVLFFLDFIRITPVYLSAKVKGEVFERFVLFTLEDHAKRVSNP